MVDPILDRLQNSALALWIAHAAWAFPVLLVLHAIGLAVGIGVFFVVSLRLLGAAPQIPLPVLQVFMPVAWLALVVTLLSGVLMFMSEAVPCYHSIAFRSKILSTVFGIAVMRLTEKRWLAVPQDRPGALTSRLAIAAAALSLVCWVTAIAAGRLLAYGV